MIQIYRDIWAFLLCHSCTITKTTFVDTSCSWPALRMYFQGLWSEMLGELYNHQAEQKPYMLGLDCYKFWLFRSICILRPLPSSGRIMLPLTNEVVHFEKLKLVSGLEEVCIFLLIPSLHILLTVKDLQEVPFTFIYIAFTFLQKHFYFSEIPNKYLLKSVSRWLSAC